MLKKSSIISKKEKQETPGKTKICSVNKAVSVELSYFSLEPFAIRTNILIAGLITAKILQVKPLPQSVHPESAPL